MPPGSEWNAISPPGGAGDGSPADGVAAAPDPVVGPGSKDVPVGMGAELDDPVVGPGAPPDVHDATSPAQSASAATTRPPTARIRSGYARSAHGVPLLE